MGEISKKGLKKVFFACEGVVEGLKFLKSLKLLSGNIEAVLIDPTKELRIPI